MVRSIYIVTIVVGFFCLGKVKGQASPPKTKFPAAASLRTLRGETVQLRTLEDTGRVSVIFFWATWCKPCINELDAIQESLGEIPANSVRWIAVSTDETRTSHQVRPMTVVRGWTYEVFLDESNEVRRYFNVSNIPVVIFLKNGNIIYQHTGYAPGDEELLIEKIRKILSEK